MRYLSMPTTPVLCAPTRAAGTLVTTPGAWTPSPWGQLLASMPSDGAILGLYLNSGTLTSTNIVDLGFGGAGSEVAVCSFACAGSLTTSDGLYLLPAPYPVTAGTRISYRVNTGSNTPQRAKLVYITSQPNTLELATGGSLVTGVERDTYPSATLWANGAWRELTASLGSTSYLWSLAIRTGIILTNSQWEIDVGVGAAGFETVIASLRWTFLQNFSNSVEMSAHMHPIGPIASGSRIAVRARANSGSTLGILVGANFQVLP